MKKNWAIFSISLLAVCACASVLLLAYVLISTQTSTTAQAIILSTPIAFDISSTPAPPPTLTPTPTLAPPDKAGNNCLTSLDYANKYMIILASLEEISPDFVTLMDKFSKNATVISDPSWQDRMEVDLAKFDKFATQLQALKPPHGLLKVDVQIKAAASEFLSFTSDVRLSIHNSDAASLENDAPHLNNFYSDMDKATQEFKKAKLDDTCG